MNAPLRQASRVGQLTTDLGPDILVILRMNGTDGLNQLFEYEVEALSTEPSLDFNALLGTHASVEIESPHHGKQPFDGIITQVSWAGVGENGHRYKMMLRPWFFLASKRRNQRIFHELTVVEILEEVFKPYAGLGDPHVDNRLQNDYRKLEYTVQYRESDLEFACRLMERFGITYHFSHKVGSHSLVLTDTVEQHDAVPGTVRPYRGVDGHHHANEEHFWEWAPERTLTTGAIRLTDWNFKTPTVAMEVEKIGDAIHEQGQLESYDFPGDYLDPGVGKGVVALRTEQERARDVRHHGTGDCTSLRAGLVLELGGEELKDTTGLTYLCLNAQHSFVSEAYGTGGGESDGYAYSGVYVFAPSTAPLAPPRVTQRPIVHGPQTAMVVGEGEIDCDEYGRILVHFPWDLAKAYSMRCRVSQNWASKGWGGMVIPRIGMEVVVEFIEGDPDMPLVTGCVYNGKNDVPYALPANKTRSLFRTDTHQGKGFNELRFEDEKRVEEIFLHAQKDLTTKVLNNSTARVDRNEVTSVGRNRFIEVAGQENHRVGGNFSLIVSGSGTETMTSAHLKRNWEGIRPLGYSLDTVGAGARGNISMLAQKNITMSSASAMALTSGQTFSQTVAEGFTLNVGGMSVTTVGESKREMIGDKLFVDAVSEIHLRCGLASFKMKADGAIELNGRRFDVTQSERINLNGGQSITANADQVDLN